MLRKRIGGDRAASFFHKVVRLRNRPGSLEQQVNGSELPEDVKVKLQVDITGGQQTLG